MASASPTWTRTAGDECGVLGSSNADWNSVGNAFTFGHGPGFGKWHAHIDRVTAIRPTRTAESVAPDRRRYRARSQDPRATGDGRP